MSDYAVFHQSAGGGFTSEAKRIALFTTEGAARSELSVRDHASSNSPGESYWYEPSAKSARPSPCWVTKDGQIYSFPEIPDDHLHNIVKMVRDARLTPEPEQWAAIEVEGERRWPTSAKDAIPLKRRLDFDAARERWPVLNEIRRGRSRGLALLWNERGGRDGFQDVTDLDLTEGELDALRYEQSQQSVSVSFKDGKEWREVQVQSGETVNAAIERALSNTTQPNNDSGRPGAAPPPARASPERRTCVSCDTLFWVTPGAANYNAQNCPACQARLDARAKAAPTATEEKDEEKQPDRFELIELD